MTPIPSACDLLVVGSGAAGMAAALSAHKAGLSPVIIEAAKLWGGSTAVSGGAIWIPGNPIAVAAGLPDDRAEARRYIAAETGNRFDAARVDAFLDTGPEAVRFFQNETALRFVHRAYSPDYHPDVEGAALGGRVLDAEDYDARGLGVHYAEMRPPIADFTIFGGMMLNRFDIGHFLNMTRKPASALHAARLLARHAWDRATRGRTTRLVLGAAVAGRLGQSVFDRGIPLLTGTPLRELLTDGAGRVTGAVVGNGAQIATRCGVVLAAGGFPHDATRQAQTYPHVSAGIPHYSMSPSGGRGEAIRAAEAVGAAFVDTNAQAAFWTPVSLIPNAHGGVRPFPHLFMDRAKPGVIAVAQDGRRFANEALSYHDFVQALVARLMQSGERSAWLIADDQALHRYGLGAVPAFPGRAGPWRRSGYLKSANGPAALAGMIGVPAAALGETIARFNRHAAAGADPDFGKGSTVYQTYLGDAANPGNPCLRPLHGGLNAIEIFAGDIGTTMGLATDAKTAVLDRQGHAIPGLYACGNDANSLMAGAYPGAGITLGPALVFGFIAGQSAASCP